MNRIILITGATSGIGEACADLFAGNGWDCILTGRRQDRLSSVEARIRREYGTDVLSLCFDVRDRAAVEKALGGLSGKWKGVEVLLNNAGLALGTEPFHESFVEDWDTMIDTNVKGLGYVTREIVPYMMGQGRGHIINISSMAGHTVYPGGHYYCASKHAVIALSKGMRIDMVSENIKVSTVSPGPTETEFSLVRYKGDKHMADQKYVGYVPLSADDVAASIYFIASQPDHVNIEEIYLMPKAQPSPFVLHRES